MAEKLSRRDFLRMSALTAAGIAVTACAKTATEAPPAPTATQPAAAEPTATPVPAGPSAKQAPMLSEMVASGALPEVDERYAPLLDILPLQRLALALALARGEDPDAPRGLKKVTATM